MYLKTLQGGGFYTFLSSRKKKTFSAKTAPWNKYCKDPLPFSCALFSTAGCGWISNTKQKQPIPSQCTTARLAQCITAVPAMTDFSYPYKNNVGIFSLDLDQINQSRLFSFPSNKSFKFFWGEANVMVFRWSQPLRMGSHNLPPKKSNGEHLAL